MPLSVLPGAPQGDIALLPALRKAPPPQGGIALPPAVRKAPPPLPASFGSELTPPRVAPELTVNDDEAVSAAAATLGDASPPGSDGEEEVPGLVADPDDEGQAPELVSNTAPDSSAPLKPPRSLPTRPQGGSPPPQIITISSVTPAIPLRHAAPRGHSSHLQATLQGGAQEHLEVSSPASGKRVRLAISYMQLDTGAATVVMGDDAYNQLVAAGIIGSPASVERLQFANKTVAESSSFAGLVFTIRQGTATISVSASVAYVPGASFSGFLFGTNITKQLGMIYEQSLLSAEPDVVTFRSTDGTRPPLL